MDYYEIGQRIRRIRKARGMSQEQLAEKVNISTTHMSHIETANTKLSLPVFIDIAEALNVPTDFLLRGYEGERNGSTIGNIVSVLEECDARQLSIVTEVVRTLRNALAVYGEENT